MRKLILISLKNSLKLVTIYPIHTVMTFIYALLNIVLNLVFWLVLSSNFGEIGLYGIKEIMVLNMFALLADSLGGFFFGYKDLSMYHEVPSGWLHIHIYHACSELHS